MFGDCGVSSQSQTEILLIKCDVAAIYIAAIVIAVAAIFDIRIVCCHSLSLFRSGFKRSDISWIT